MYFLTMLGLQTSHLLSYQPWDPSQSSGYQGNLRGGVVYIEVHCAIWEKQEMLLWNISGDVH